MYLIRPFVLLVSLYLAWPVLAEANQKKLPDPLDLPAQMDARALHSLLLDVAAAGQRLVAVGERGNILYSDDQGKSWLQAQVPVQVTLTATHFPTPLLGWAVGHDGVILHSRDGGVTWKKQLDGYQTGKLMARAAQQQMEKLTIAIEAAEKKGTDAEALSEARDNAEIALDEAQTEIDVGPNRPLLDVWFQNEQVGYASGAFGYLFRTVDGGNNWQDISLHVKNPERLHLYGIQGWSDGTLLVVGEFGFAQRSKDAGATWQVIDLDYDGTLFSVMSGVVDKEAFIVGLRGNVFHSRDRGQNWQRYPLPKGPSLLGVAGTAERVLMVGVAGTIIELDKNRSDYQYLSRKNRINLSSVQVTALGNLIVVGESGVLRLSVAGEPLPVTYTANAASLKKETFSQMLFRSADPAIAQVNSKYPGAAQ